PRRIVPASPRTPGSPAAARLLPGTPGPWSRLLMPLPNRPIRTALLMLLAALLLVPTAVAQTPLAPATPVGAPTYDPASLHAIKPERREEIAAILPAGLAEYAIDVTFPQDA